MRATSALAAVLLLAACDGDPDVIDANHVQPDGLEKSQFQGEWYFRQTVLEVPYETSLVREGFATRLERVRFEIQENALIAYRTVDHVDGAGDRPEFQPVAAWVIEKHFDVATERRTDTDPETNLTYEDDRSRPWWERAYVRVDWSRDILLRAADLQTYPGELAVMKGTEAWVSGQDEEDPDRIEIEPGYMSVVGVYTLEPDAWACSRFVDLTFGHGDSSACLPATVRRRSSFLKIDPDRPAYAPLDYPDRAPLGADLDGDDRLAGGEKLGRVLRICTSASPDGTCAVVDGVPQTTLVECTPEVLQALAVDPFYSRYAYGPADCELEREPYFERFGFARTERPYHDRHDGVVGFGRLELINRWNLWERSFDGDGVSIPYAQRTPRPIAFHTSAGFPPELLPEAHQVAREWGAALLETVAALQGKRVTEYGELQMLELRENTCSAAGVRAFVEAHPRMHAVVNRVAGGVSRVDGTNLVRVCAALETNSEFRWQKPGDLRHSMLVWVPRPQLDAPVGLTPRAVDPLTGEIVAASVYVYGASIDRQAAMATDIVQLTRGDLELDDVIRGEDLRARIAAGRSTGTDEERFEAALQDLAARAAGWPGPGDAPPGWEQSRLDMLAGDPALERSLLDVEDLWHAGWRPGEEVDAGWIDRTSLRTRRARQAARAEMAQRLGAGDCYLPEAFTDPGVVGMAAEYDAADRSRDDVLMELRARIFGAVARHEVGHALGLRHNFAASYDALNYHDRFWEIRANYPGDIHQAVSLATGTDREALARCIELAEEWNVPAPTSGECLREAELKTSSVMDYGARFNAKFGGVGKYDRAAIRFGYGQLIDVFADEVGVSAEDVRRNLFVNDYRQIPDWIGGPQMIRRRRLVRLPDLMKARVERIRAASSPDVLPVIDPATGQCRGNCGEPAPEPVEVPYRFCSDEYADGESLDCRRWDEGANTEEIVDAVIRRSAIVEPFLAYRRGRVGWQPEDYLRDLRERTLAPLASAFRQYVLWGRRYESFPVGRSLALGSMKGLIQIDAMLRPAAGGWYCLLNGKFYNEQQLRGCDRSTPGEKIFLQGRRYWDTFDPDHYPGVLDSVGLRHDRREALRALTALASDEPGSTGAGYYPLYAAEIRHVLAGLMTGEVEAGVVIRTDQGLRFATHTPADPGVEVVGRLVSAGSYDPLVALEAATYAFTSLSSPHDGVTDVSDYLFVTLKGAPDDLEFPGVDRDDPAQYVELQDPVSFKTYVAVNTSDGGSITHRLLTRAKDRMERYWRPAKARLDAAQPGSAEYRAAKADLEFFEQDLRHALGFLDHIRALRRLYVPAG